MSCEAERSAFEEADQVLSDAVDVRNQKYQDMIAAQVEYEAAQADAEAKAAEANQAYATYASCLAAGPPDVQTIAFAGLQKFLSPYRAA